MLTPEPTASPIRVAVVGAGAFGRNHLRVYRELESAHLTTPAPQPSAQASQPTAHNSQLTPHSSPAKTLEPQPTKSPLAPLSEATIRAATPPDPTAAGRPEGAGAFRPLNPVPETRSFSPGPSVQLAALVDASPAVREEASARYGIPAFASVDDLLAANLGLDAASICVPTVHHFSLAEQLLHAGLDVLIEKPFAATLDQADAILALAHEKQRIVQIGHLERFNPAVTATIARLNRPMFFEAHRLSLFTPRSLDVDVVLDLMIHDLDIVLTLAQSEVREVRATGIPILSRKVDIANVRVEFHSGAVANFTASRVSTEQVRKLRLFQPHQYLSLDFARQELISIDVDPALAAQIAAGQMPPATVPASHPTAGLSLEKIAAQRAEPLRLELEDFLHSVRSRTAPRVTAQAGRNALALAFEINREIAAHAHRAGLL